MRLLTTLMILAASFMPLAADDKPAANAYRLDFTLRDTVQGQPAKTRHFSMLLLPDSWGRLDVGSKVPYTTEKDKYNFADVGVSIRARIAERSERVNLETHFEVSSLSSGGNLPVIQQVRSEGSASVALGKSTMVFSLDDPANEHHYDVDAVITKM